MITNIELSILMFIQEHLRTDFFNEFWILITHLGDGGWFWIVLGILLLLFKKTRVIGITLLISLGINGLLTNLTLKDFFARPRPFNVSDGITTLIKRPRSFSFPSGHTSVSFAGALVLYKMMPKKVGIPAVVLAAMIGFSRMYVGVHYPTDVLGGISVGIIASRVSYYWIGFVKKKKGEENLWLEQKNKN